MAATLTSAKKADENDVLLEMETRTSAAQAEDQGKGLYFNDGRRRIDYVLVYETSEEKKDEDAVKEQEEHAQKREAFEKNLEKAGLQLEREHKTSPQVNNLEVVSGWYDNRIM